MDNYHVLNLIGEGSFGKVYRGRRKYTGQIVALKFIPKVGKSEKELRSLRREIEIMKGLQHDNIIQLIDNFDTDQEVVVVTDYAEGELFQILEDDGNLPEDQVQSIACQLVSALFYLHSHRILHRDMKPQNILLGKGGVIKLCDFGFARAMSMNTLVLTSIKGTPLYMSPELVEEKPYDHNADLWALGCILYELHTGTPPFYTNSIFQLVSLIIKDPVKWPKSMSPACKDFLQGLLIKNPKQRLSWPDLLHHPFVAHGITVAEADLNLRSPFTQPLSASMASLKERQTKERAHPPGTSKILSKARKKALEKDNHKDQTDNGATNPDQPDQPEVPPDIPPNQPPGLVLTDRPTTAPGTKEDDPTPRTDRISKDYMREYPDIDVGGRRTLRKHKDAKPSNIQSVKLDEEVDSDDEWQAVIDVTEQDDDCDKALDLLKNTAMLRRLNTLIETSAKHVLQGMLEGASKLRSGLRVVANLLTLKCDVEMMLNFTDITNIPKFATTLLGEILDKSTVKKQPWCSQILVDLVVCVNAYLASEIGWATALPQDRVSVYVDLCLQFTSLVPSLISQDLDTDGKLREQTLLCLVYICETLERDEMDKTSQYYSAFSSKHLPVLDALLSASLLKSLPPDKVTEDKDTPLTHTHHLSLLCVGCMAALCYIPLTMDKALDSKRKMARHLGDKLAQEENKEKTEYVISTLTQAESCSNTLKLIYACCQTSMTFCTYLSDSGLGISHLLHILLGQVAVADMEVNSIIEITLHILSTLVIQLQDVPKILLESTSTIVSIFMDSQIASHTAAAALLFSQLVYCGIAVDIRPNDMVMSCLAIFTDLAQICERCPFDYGVLDGVLLLLCELLFQTNLPVSQLYMESGVWSALCHRVAQSLQVHSACDAPIEAPSESTTPDWGLISPHGLTAVLQMTLTVFSKEMFQCIGDLAMEEGILLLTLSHLLSQPFLKSLKLSCERMLTDLILQVTQILCFPFAVDPNDELLQQIHSSYHKTSVLPRLIQSCTHLDIGQLDTPMGLVSRLVLSGDTFISQFVECVDHNTKSSKLLHNIISERSRSSNDLMCHTLSVCSHLVRSPPHSIAYVTGVFSSTKGDFGSLCELVDHSCTQVKSRALSLLGNLLKYNHRHMYTILQSRNDLFASIKTCLCDTDNNVRKCASFVVGNASYHSGKLYQQIQPCIPVLCDLLHDPVVKIRSNAASCCGNLAIHSSELCTQLSEAKLINSLIDVACHDSQCVVQDAALVALRSMASQPVLKKEMCRLHTSKKLSTMSIGGTPRTPRPQSTVDASAHIPRGHMTTIMAHCTQLIKWLDS